MRLPLILLMAQTALGCNAPLEIPAALLASLLEGPVISSYIPTAYFAGEGTKYISTEHTEIFHENLCVDDQTTPVDIQLFDDGTNGDDVAGDGIYSRSCIHFCQTDYSDIWGFAYGREVWDAQLIEISSSLKDAIPYEVIQSPLYPDAQLVATSHAAFFVDDTRKYLTRWPFELVDTVDGPTGRNVPVGSFLSIFGDVFDYLTVSGLDTNQAITGFGIYKWQRWERAGGPQPEEGLGGKTDIIRSRTSANHQRPDAEDCMIGLTGVPTTRLVGVNTAANILSEPGGLMHELIHGVSGYEYQNALDKARSGDGAHVPGACTIDHSELQATIWDWEKGAPYGIKTSYCLEEEEEANGGEFDDFCYYQASDTIRLEANDDCASCPDDELANCCSFRYEEAISVPSQMITNPDLFTMSPLMSYIAGFITYEEMMTLPTKYRVFYCMGSDTDGGCGLDPDDPERARCTVAVDDTDRLAVSSPRVERYTFDDLVAANGGQRDPPLRAERDLRHGMILLSQRLPSQAEMVLYTMLMRHHEVEEVPHARLREGNEGRRNPLTTWLWTTQGRSTLHSRLHGIECGGGLQVPSCGESADSCDSTVCDDNAECLNIDGRPLCQCNDGYVGDGSLCVPPVETVKYPLKSAHETFQTDRSFCFGSSWPLEVAEDAIPLHPGGIPPYKVENCQSLGGCEEESSNCRSDPMSCLLLRIMAILLSVFQ